MFVIKNREKLEEVELVATIGFFDGVHLGHQFLIRSMKEYAARLGLPTAVITFPQHPRKVLQADYQPKLLNSFEEKLSHLEDANIDYCIVLDFTPELASLSAEEFIASLLHDRLHVKVLFVGYDHRFGHNREDGIERYVEYGKRYGMKVINADSYTEGALCVSSSEIRRLLMKGQVEEAARMLTYPYQLKGRIVKGHRIGREIGFPTANIEVDEPFKVIPAVGVYAVKVLWQEKVFLGMLYIGNRPTLNNGENITLEVNILDFSEEIYNNEMTVTFIKYIRGDIRFDSLEALKEQIIKDRNIIQEYGTFL